MEHNSQILSHDIIELRYTLFYAQLKRISKRLVYRSSMNLKLTIMRYLYQDIS